MARKEKVRLIAKSSALSISVLLSPWRKALTDSHQFQDLGFKLGLAQ